MNEDIRVKLLHGKPLKLNPLIEIKPLTLGRIDDFGVTNYLKSLSLLTTSDEDIQELFKMKDIDTYTHLCMQCVFPQQLKEDILSDELVLNALKLFSGEEVQYYNEQFYLGEISLENTRIINKANFKDFVKILKWQNCIKEDEIEKDDEFNPANDMVAKELEKLKKAREKLRKTKLNKNNSDDVPEFGDLISVACESISGINIFNVWDLTMYQFNHQFARSQLKDKYKLDVSSMLAGAKMENLDNWMKKI